ncbi:DUF6522 family protein [Pseudooceanicola nanhaiensis]|uniref:DUF6522 family protein n=1 Tax=Pseudooceanicola nanhaiensis TaxID=375761 RepID=UPI00300925A8
MTCNRYCKYQLRRVSGTKALRCGGLQSGSTIGAIMICSVTVSEEGFVVDAALVGRAFSLSSDDVREEMRKGQITVRSETGIGRDEGRWRLTFVRDRRALRLIVNRDGDVLSQGTFPVSANRPPSRPAP